MKLEITFQEALTILAALARSIGDKPRPQQLVEDMEAALLVIGSGPDKHHLRNFFVESLEIHSK